MLLLTLRETYALNRLSSFKKGGKFDHRPGRQKVLLRHWNKSIGNTVCAWQEGS